MIAAGLCVMGGCFAQDASTGMVDCYWPASGVGVPRFSNGGSLSLYEHDVVPAGVDINTCRVYSKQLYRSGDASSFFVFQDGNTPYNCYVVSSFIEVVNNQGEHKHSNMAQNSVVEFHADSGGARVLTHGIGVGPCNWDSSRTGERLRLLDTRNGEKDFYVAYGQWGWKWYLLPMRSVLNTAAVFDFEEKVLVEL